MDTKFMMCNSCGEEKSVRALNFTCTNCTAHSTMVVLGQGMTVELISKATYELHFAGNVATSMSHNMLGGIVSIYFVQGRWVTDKENVSDGYTILPYMVARVMLKKGEDPKEIVLEDGMVVKLISREEYAEIVPSDVENFCEMASGMYEGTFTITEGGVVTKFETTCTDPWIIRPYMVALIMPAKGEEPRKCKTSQEEAEAWAGNMKKAEAWAEDKGSHYRYEYKGVKVDPYRVCKIYNIEGGPHEHMTKKLLRGTEKGHSEEELIKELQCCLDRWKEMIEEDTSE